MISKTYPLPRLLFGAMHYHHPGSGHPCGHRIRSGVERVELVTGGRGWVDVGGQWVEVTPGSLLWHVSGDVTIGRSDDDSPYRCLAVNFGVPRNSGRRVARVTRWPELDEVRAFTHRVVATYVDESFDPGALLAYAYGRLIFQARRWQAAGTSGEVGSSELLAQVLAEIERRYPERLTLSDLGGAVGWSVPHLHRVFRQSMGMSPHQFVLNRRIREAKFLLISTDYAVKRIAFDCGFGSASAFCHAFKNRVGIQPLEYRHLESTRDFSR